MRPQGLKEQAWLMQGLFVDWGDLPKFLWVIAGNAGFEELKAIILGLGKYFKISAPERWGKPRLYANSCNPRVMGWGEDVPESK